MKIETYKRTGEDSWSVVEGLGLLQVHNYASSHVIVYGCSDPEPNPAELMLTQGIAEVLGLPWRFFIYRHGKNLKSGGTFTPRWPICYLEEIIEEVELSEVPLKELAQEIFHLRGEHCIVARREDGSVLRTDTDKKRFPASIRELHRQGGWLGGSSIHYILRLWAEKNSNVVYLCPFQQKGRVYNIYRWCRPLFIPAPFLQISPPKWLNLPDWAPLLWKQWRELSASRRRYLWREIRGWLRQWFKNPYPAWFEVSWEELVS